MILDSKEKRVTWSLSRDWRWELFWLSGQGSFIWGGDIWKETWTKWESKWCEDMRKSSLRRGNSEGWRRKTSLRCLRNSKEPVWLEHEEGETGKADPAMSRCTVKAKKNFMNWWGQGLYLDLLHSTACVYHSMLPVCTTFSNGEWKL